MHWHRTKQVSDPLLGSPSLRPISVADAKSHCRVEGSDEDTLIEGLIDAVVARVEGPNGIGLSIMARQWRVTLDYFPSVIFLEVGPVLSVDAIRYVDTDGTTQTLDADDYTVDLDHDPARVVPAYNATWPATRQHIGVVTVLYTAGYSQGEAVPRDLRLALLQLIAHNFENREAVIVGQTAIEIPLGARDTLERYRVGRFG